MRFTESHNKYEIEITDIDQDFEIKWLRAEIDRIKVQSHINYMALRKQND